MKPVLEQIQLGRKKSILAFNYKKKNFDAPWHFHPQHELTYIQQSVGSKFIGDYVGPYRPGELVLLRSNLPHCWKNDVHQEASSISTVVQWNKGIFHKAPEILPLFTMIGAASKGILFVQNDYETLIPQLLMLPALDGDELYLQLLSLLISLSHCRYSTLSANSFTDDLPEEFSNRMSIIHDFVETNYHRKIYLRELAKLVSMSEQSFSRFFSKMMGRPFFAFLSEYRINMASRMLIETDWPVSQIGYKCGFESLPFFHKQFNRYKQLTPSRYRRKYALKV